MEEEQAVFESLVSSDFKMCSSTTLKTFNNYSIIMNKNSASYQNSAWLANQMVALRRGVDYLLEFVSCERANGFKKRQKKIREN